MTKVAILQSNYIPWKGYFDIIHDVDVCVFYDCVQFTWHDWRNRNQLIMNGVKKWLTVPLRHCPLSTPIHAVEIDNSRPWQERHHSIIREHYCGAPYFDAVMDLLKPFIARPGSNTPWTNLSQFNQALVQAICGYLGIRAKMIDSKCLNLEGSATDRVLDAVKKIKGTHYLSGPSAKNYLEEAKFRAEGITLEYKDYSDYPPYPQFSKEFDHQVSILDLLLQTGPSAPGHIWGWRKETKP